MKKILFALIFTWSSSFYGIAQTPVYEIDPTPGDVESITDVTITFPNAQSVEIAELSYETAPIFVHEGTDPNDSANGFFCFGVNTDGNKVVISQFTAEATEGAWDFYVK
ncbi:MAG: hypothetical protein HDR88_17340, partial [Bacteroides sp.]|nr:hypothetical protein [Bacteroides sp.]